jgi:hypothetical protein
MDHLNKMVVMVTRKKIVPKQQETQFDIFWVHLVVPSSTIYNRDHRFRNYRGGKFQSEKVAYPDHRECQAYLGG